MYTFIHFQAQQNQENCDYIKQNGQATLEELHKHHNEVSTEIKADDDLGFDPFHETQKALAELMENEMQLQQQRLFQQQQQQREREEQNRAQQQGLTGLGPLHFPQVSKDFLINKFEISFRIYCQFIHFL